MAGHPNRNQIEKFSFTVDGNATDVGDVTVTRGYLSGNSSTVNGYAAGGLPFSNVIDNFPFSVDTNATDVGDLTVARYGQGGASSDDHGYTHGGEQPPSGGYNVIDKYTFASNANATDVGDITLVMDYTLMVIIVLLMDMLLVDIDRAPLLM